jgi:hypothetical protein
VSSSVFKRSFDGTGDSGFVQVVDPISQKSLGYVARSFTVLGQYIISLDLSSALEVRFDPRLARSGSMPLKVIVPQDDDYPFLGLIVASTNKGPWMEIEAGSPNYACIGMASELHTSARELVMNHNFAHDHFPKTTESNVWRIDSSSHSLIPRWTGLDGFKANARLLYIPTNGTLCLVGDKYESLAHQSGLPVELRLVPSS